MFDESLARGTITSGRRALFKTGSVTRAAFDRFFGVTTGNPVMPSILIRLPADIDAQPIDPIRVSGPARRRLARSRCDRHHSPLKVPPAPARRLER